MKHLKTFETFDHPSSLPIFTYPDGINYGGPNKDHFGRKGKKGDGGKEFPVYNGYYSEVADKYYTPDEIKQLFLDYKVWCKQNGEEINDDMRIDGPSIDYMLKKMDTE